MLKFATKADLWNFAGAGRLEGLPEEVPWTLKSAQDAIVWAHLRDLEGLRIAEIGGGKSRILPLLAQTNDCSNIEKFEGLANGPKQPIHLDNVANIDAYVGDSSGIIEDGQFDQLFSISVVEHVGDAQLPQFFRDAARILAPGGSFIHLIDAYLYDSPEENRKVGRRIKAYLQPFHDGIYRHAGAGDEVLDATDVRFSCSYLTHPDDGMARRNRLAPRLKSVREVSQSCTLVMSGRRA